MPLDGSNFTIIDDLAALRTARRSIARPGNWANGGDPDTWGGANCIAGWVTRAVLSTTHVRDETMIMEEADRLIADYMVPELRDDRNKHRSRDVRLLRFNDQHSTTLADVVALFDRAIARAKARLGKAVGENRGDP